MCGLVGAAGDLSHIFRTAVFKDFLDVCQVRGRDSTGVIKVPRDTESYDWVKQVGSPAYLYDGKQYHQCVEQGEASVLIGHCRAKTIGEVSIKNAHPFDFPKEGICGVHNGTLSGTYKLDGYKHGMVDSEVLYQHLAENGAESTFSTIEGAWACVWWNHTDRTLNMIRNDKRPLYFTWSDDLRQMFWASEPWMFAAVERKVKLWDGGKEKKKIIELPINTLWSFRIDANARGDDKVFTLQPERSIIPFVDRTPVVRQVGFGVGSNSNWTYNPATKTSTRADEADVKGGEGKSPFLDRIRKEIPGWDNLTTQQKSAIIKRRKNTQVPLNDQIKDLFGIEDDQTPTPLSNVAFLNTSAQPSDSMKDVKSPKRRRKPLISLPDRE